jgi:nucleoside-diphosphate-sugar epimerase
MPSYDRWPTDFFPILDGTVSAAESVGARIIVLGNLYGYGERAANPHTSDAPLDPTTRKGTVRTIMWERARRSRAPALEIRASDYLGQNAVGQFTLLALTPLLERKEVGFPGDLDASHAWAFTKDVARTLVAAAGYKGEWGRAFLAPSRNASVRELVAMFAAQRNIGVPQLLRLTTDELEAAGYHELIEMAYLFNRPFLVDTSDTETQLGVRASSLDEMIEDTLRGFH